jgi:hypothetical protein
MESRSVVKMRNSFYICLPSSMAEALEIKRGDRCRFLLLPGYGILLRKEGMDGKFPAPLEAIANLKQAADEIVHEARRKIRGMEAQCVFHIWEKIFGLCLKDGLVNIFPPIPITEETQKLLFTEGSEGERQKGEKAEHIKELSKG